ncbi:hypothetical protein FRC07_013639 [Ceratobasidium sp. 392]|nr:hypothetical protein FRC07_013639 [Ceratobasidium sp. 392]
MSSKRKMLAAGYKDLGDEHKAVPVDSAASVKKLRPTTPTLPRLGGSTTPQPGRAPFQFPTLKNSFGRSVSLAAHSRATSLSRQSTPSAPETPQTSGEPLSIDNNSSESEHEGPDAERTKQDVSCKTKKPKLTVRTARGVRLLERQVSVLHTELKEHREASAMSHKENSEKLTKLLEVVALLTPSSASPMTGPGSGTASPVALHTVPLPDGTPVSNPMPSPELLASVAKVASLTAKSFGAYKNAVTGHARDVWYHMLDIAAAKEIRPYYLDAYGNHDVFPEQFVDPVTKYCMPFPHWGKTFQKQALWVPTYVNHFIGLIPKGDSELSVLLRGLSHEDIVVLLYNGPWKSALAAWRSANVKTEKELEKMQLNQAIYHQAQKKAQVRAEYIKLVPDLQGPEYKFMTHPGYMSDEYEAEGKIVIKRPTHRAPWVNNYFEAVRSAEAQKPKARPGPAPLPQDIRFKNLPLPLLTSGVGNSKTPVRIACSALAYKWREQTRADFLKYSAQADMKVVAKPDISDFLIQNPRLIAEPLHDHEPSAEKLGDGMASERDAWNGDEAACSSGGGEYDGAYGRHALSDDLVLDLGNSQDNPESQLDCPTQHATDSQHNAETHNFPLDPQLVDVTTSSIPVMSLGAHPPMPPPPMPDAEAATMGADLGEPPAPKRRGRPKGSKNKPKVLPTELVNTAPTN